MCSRWLSGAGVAVLFLVSVAPGRCAPGRAKTAPARPRLVVERTEHDAGKILPGDALVADFPLRNVGRAPLHILDVKKDCGCTVPTCDTVIPPGKTGHLRVALRTAGFQGTVEKHVYLESDDPKLASIAFTVKATFPRPVEVTPSTEVVVPITPGQPATTEVTLRATDANTLDVGPIESPSPYVTAEVRPGTPASGSEVRLRIVVAAGAPAEGFETVLRVGTGHPGTPHIEIRLFGQPSAAVAVRPPRMAFGHLRPAEKGPIVRLLTVSRATGTFRILKAEDSLGCLRLQLLPGADAGSYEIRVTYAGGWTREQTEGVVRITTDDPARPVIEVPYSAEVW